MASALDGLDRMLLDAPVQSGGGNHLGCAGQAFVDVGHGHVHSAYNPGTGPTVFIATFFEAPATGALLIPADPAC